MRWEETEYVVYAPEVLKNVCPAVEVLQAEHDWVRLGWAYGCPLSVCKWSVEPQFLKVFKQSSAPGEARLLGRHFCLEAATYLF
jgi:hypothetical protein